MPESRENTEEIPPDPWSWQFAVVSGIALRLHFSLILMLVYISVTRRGLFPFVLGLLFCILLHELGHALTARRLGYPLRRITLYPIGGIAALEENPKPRHELWIAIAGPAVNVVIVAVLSLAFRLTGSGLFERLYTIQHQPGSFLSGGDTLALLAFANLSLVCFNLVPAFPMDGGRILRALLALRMGEMRATFVAARIGQGLAVLGGLYGVLSQNFTLILIALFVFFGAAQELQGEATRGAVEGAVASDAMVTDLATLLPGATLDDAAKVLIATSQQDFPVVLGGEVLGILSRDRLLRAIAEHGRERFVSEAMERDFLRVEPGAPLEPVLLRPDGLRKSPVIVVGGDGGMLGMVTQENVMEFVILRRIAEAREGSTPA